MTATTRKMLTVVAASAAATLLIMHIAADAGAQAATSVAIDVGDPSGCAEINEGDEIEVQIRIANVTDLQHWEATIVHDRDLLEIVSQDTRQFLVQEPGSNTIDASDPLPDYNGRHFLGIADASAASESGDGVLAIVVFKGVGEGTTSIDIPQFDFNGDGRTDEGISLTRYGGAFIGDVNGDQFFDGNVQPGYVAVGEDCSAVTTESPTDPPTPVASPTGTDSATTGGGTDGGTATQPPASGEATSPADSGEPPDSGDTDSITPTKSGSQDVESPSASATATSRQGDDGSGEDGGGSSFPLWLIAVLLAGGLAAGGAVIAFAMRRSPDTRF